MRNKIEMKIEVRQTEKIVFFPSASVLIPVFEADR
jgi:hypothetical protein